MDAASGETEREVEQKLDKGNKAKTKMGLSRYWMKLGNAWKRKEQDYQEKLELSDRKKDQLLTGGLVPCTIP